MNNCPFCNFDRRKFEFISETENTLTIFSNPSLVLGHCLVLPKRHVEKLSELNKGDLQGLFSEVIKTQELLLENFGGCDLVQNYRPFMPQSRLKINHLHIHLRPRELFDNLYKKSQIFETNLFKDLTQEEIKEIKMKYFLK